MSEPVQNEDISLKYKAISLLFGGPRYLSEASEVAGKVQDQVFASAVNNIAKANSENSEKIETQYTACFVNNFPKLPCPPYESWYLDGSFHGAAVARLTVWYRKFGLFPAALPEDHISAIAEFAAYLYHTDKAEADKFVREHFLTWAGKFADDIAKKCTNEYVKELGSLLQSFLNDEIERLRDSR
ncbi:MAG: molecular chaperone TorD family protein [Nitrososphaerota archaeon]|nr:molecular chaperone TorD family protein [Nitrososphaerota archaeon]MDG6931074.1 molecular chaperone TorD family protein [Nitrososphaerota archaeon]